jgi:hypothetical protein
MATPGFPTAPSFTTEALQPPPALRPDIPVEDQIKEIHNFLNSQWVSLNSMQTSIESGWLIDTVRILNLEASTITSGSIFTQDLYVGEDQLITLSGLTNRIEVEDENGQIRTRIGNLGAGATNWGQEWWDSSGNLIMSVGDTVFIDGAVILNATITNAKIVDMNGSKLTDGTVSNAKLGNISASKITLSGTLTITSGGTAIDITSGGLVRFLSGGDALFRAGASNFNYITFQNSGGSTQGTLRLDASGLGLVASGTTAVQLSAGSGAINIVNSGIINLGGASTTLLRLGLSSSTSIDVNGRIASGLLPDADNARTNGSASLRWSLVRGVTITPGDLVFENDIVITEPDKVYRDADPCDGLCFLSTKWEMIAWLHKNGNMEVAGEVKEKVRFKKPHYKYKEAHERVH